ncbi:MAG: uL13 family ribosomal protein [Brevinematales bacterium]
MMMNKKSLAFLVVFIFYIFLLKGYFNLLFATIIFAYFTEVLIEVFTKLKEKIVKNIEKIKFSGEKLKKKKYYSHSGYLGGLKVKSLEEVFKKDPKKVDKLIFSRYNNKLFESK